MINPDSLVSAVCFILFLVGLAFIYYLSRLTQYNGASEVRARRRIEDVAYYLSKLEEQMEDVESQIHKKIDAHELETRIRLTQYDQAVTKIVQKRAVKKVNKG